MTRAPAWARASAVARPMPREAPVTRAVLPFRSVTAFLLLRLLRAFRIGGRRALVGAGTIAARSGQARCRAARVCAAVDGQVCARDVRSLRAGDEGNQCGYFVHGSVTVERGVGYLRRRPITCSGVQVRIDRAGLNIVDRDAAVANFSGQPL